MRQIFVKTFELRSKVKRYIFQNTQCSEKHADNVGLYVGLILDKKITSYFNMRLSESVVAEEGLEPPTRGL